MLSQSQVEAFVRQFDVPAVARPYLPAMFAEDDVFLALLAGDGSIDLAAAQRALGCDATAAEAALEAAFRRGVFDRRYEDGRWWYSPTSFYTRMDYFATFEDWQALPPDVRASLDEWMLARYVESVRPNVERLRAGLPPERSPGNDSVLLLNELDAVIDAAKTIAVFPCNCRRIAGNCDRPVEVCLQFEGTARDKLERGYGRQLTSEEAKELVRWADRKGLMHTTDLDWVTEGPAPICNCCADDCYVFRASTLLGSKGIWPHIRYVAAYDQAACDRCGVCVRRCHFGAFRHDGTVQSDAGKERQAVVYDSTLCRGCGLCANTCPKSAISMQSLERATSRR